MIRLIKSMSPIVYTAVKLYCAVMIIASMMEKYSGNVRGSDSILGDTFIVYELWVAFALGISAYLEFSARRAERKAVSDSKFYIKRENTDLKQFRKIPAYNKPPWTIGISFLLIGQCIVFRTYGAIPFLLLWVLDQVIQFCRLNTVRERIYYSYLRKEVLGSRLEEHACGCNPLIYGLLMKDDTRRVAGTFGMGYDRPDKLPVFDLETEILPWKNRINANDDFMIPFYINAAFMIYVLDASRYSFEELEAECEKAVSAYHYQISRLTYIYIIGDFSEYAYLQKRYKWLWEVQIFIVQNLRQINMYVIEDEYIKQKCLYRQTNKLSRYISADSSFWTIAFYKLFKKQFFCQNSLYGLNEGSETFAQETNMKACYEFYSRYNYCVNLIYASIPKQMTDWIICPGNTLLCGFLQNYFRPNELSTAILSGFDYADLLLRTVLFYLIQKRCQTSDDLDDLQILREVLEKKDLQFLGEEIIKFIREEDIIFENIKVKSIKRNTALNNALWILGELAYLEIEGDELCFEGLITLFRLARNATRGHGSIKTEIAVPLWYAEYILLVILGDVLRIHDFQVLVKEESVYWGYSSDKQLYSAGQYAIVHNHKPCLLYESKKNGEKNYINYYEGEPIVPRFI